MIQLTCLSRLSHYDDVWIRAIEGFLCLRSKRSGLLLSAIKLRPPHRQRTDYRFDTPLVSRLIIYQQAPRWKSFRASKETRKTLEPALNHFFHGRLIELAQRETFSLSLPKLMFSRANFYRRLLYGKSF